MEFIPNSTRFSENEETSFDCICSGVNDRMMIRNIQRRKVYAIHECDQWWVRTNDLSEYTESLERKS